MRKTILLGLGAAFLSAGALAQQAPAGHEHHGGPHMAGQDFFERLDTNKDGKVTRAEAEAARAQRFAEIDANKDGGLSKEELAAHHARMKAMLEQRMAARHDAMFTRHDANKDGKLSAAEFEGQMQGMDRMFQRLDVNKDGAITKDEMQQARGAWKAKPGN